MSKITMRAKFQVQSVTRGVGIDRINCNEVAAKSYGNDGLDEDNTYAKFSPSGSLELSIANPALLGVIQPGQKFYLDFTPAE